MSFTRVIHIHTRRRASKRSLMTRSDANGAVFSKPHTDSGSKDSASRNESFPSPIYESGLEMWKWMSESFSRCELTTSTNAFKSFSHFWWSLEGKDSFMYLFIWWNSRGVTGFTSWLSTVVTESLKKVCRVGFFFWIEVTSQSQTNILLVHSVLLFM